MNNCSLIRNCKELGSERIFLISNPSRPLRPRKRHQRRDVVAIGGAQRGDVALPQLAGAVEAAASPSESLAAQPHDEQIGDKPRTPAGAAGEGVNQNEAVMEPDGDLIGRIGGARDPRPRVVDELAHLDRNLPRRDAQIALAGTVASRPAPHVAEHAAMQLEYETLVENLAPPAQRPVLPAGDVVLLGGVEFPAKGDMRRDQVVLFLRRERCAGIVRRREQIAHTSFHKSRDLIVCAKSSIRASRSAAGRAWFSSSMLCSTACRRLVAIVRARSFTVVASYRFGTSA